MLFHGVLIQPSDNTSAPIRIERRDGEWLESFTWEVTGDWMEVAATFLCLDRMRVVTYVVRASWVAQVIAVETTPQKDRSAE